MVSITDFHHLIGFYLYPNACCHLRLWDLFTNLQQVDRLFGDWLGQEDWFLIVPQHLSKSCPFRPGLYRVGIWQKEQKTGKKWLYELCPCKWNSYTATLYWTEQVTRLSYIQGVVIGQKIFFHEMNCTSHSKEIQGGKSE